jgi:hypothetical protein
VNASLLAVVEDVRAGACRGVRACGAALNTSLPSAAVLLDAVLHLEVRCSDFDNLQESVESVQIGLRELHSREEPRGEFDAGPWPGCFRACGARRTVLDGYDAVQDVCWDARGRVCARKLVTHTWDPAEETRWVFLQAPPLPLPCHLRIPLPYASPCHTNTDATATCSACTTTTCSTFPCGCARQVRRPRPAPRPSY